MYFIMFQDWTLSDKSVEDPDSVPGRTLAPIYQNRLNFDNNKKICLFDFVFFFLYLTARFDMFFVFILEPEILVAVQSMFRKL